MNRLPSPRTARVMRIATPPNKWIQPHQFGNLLFDLQVDPLQEHPIHDEVIEKRMIEHLIRLMRENDAPPEQFERLGL